MLTCGDTRIVEGNWPVVIHASDVLGIITCTLKSYLATATDSVLQKSFITNEGLGLKKDLAVEDDIRGELRTMTKCGPLFVSLRTSDCRGETMQ